MKRLKNLGLNPESDYMMSASTVATSSASLTKLRYNYFINLYAVANFGLRNSQYENIFALNTWYCHS
ncbi:hypothetical protein Plhal304r1_c061g0148071 [Plasmopara halstedii]